MAWKYLRDREKANWSVFAVGLVLLFSGGGFAVITGLLPGPDVAPNLSAGGLHISHLTFYLGVGFMGLGLMVTIFGSCLAVFNLFTTISIFGVFLGVTALIVVLSVMSGFESDLREKILGNNAHIRIRAASDELISEKRLISLLRQETEESRYSRGDDSTRSEAAEVDPSGSEENGVEESAGEKEDGDEKPGKGKNAEDGFDVEIDGIIAISPYLQAEVVLTGPKTHMGVYLKGIVPRRADKVSDLGQNIVEGVLSNLEHPERLRFLYFTDEFFDAMDLLTPFGERDTPDPPLLHEPKVETLDEPEIPELGSELFKNIDPVLKRRPEVWEEGKVPGIENDISVLMGDDFKKKPFHDDTLGFPGTRVTPLEQKVLPGIVVGTELAKTVGLQLGDTVDVVSSDAGSLGPMGPIPRIRSFRVAGIFFSGHYEFDTKYAYVRLLEAQDFLKQEGMITGVEIRVTDIKKVAQVAGALKSLVLLDKLASYDKASSDEDDELVVQSWQQIHKNLFSALKLEKIVMFLVLAIIVLVASFSIGCNLIMMVRKKRGEIATLKSLGADNPSIYRIFVIEGVYIGFLGMLLGLGVGMGACMFLKYFGLRLDPEIYYISRLPVQINPVDIFAICLACVGISFGATLYPAWQAAQLHPVEAFRTE